MDRYEGFREFVLARGPALTRFAYLLTGDPGSAEELVQSALATVVPRWRRLAAEGNPEAYLRRVMVNDRISRWRRWGRREVPVPDLPDAVGPDESARSVQRLDLAGALARLPVRQRAVIVLRFYEDLSEADTAAVMGCAVGTVKSQTSAALTRLRRLLPILIDDATEVAR